jgi:uracil-DNA glycosylase
LARTIEELIEAVRQEAIREELPIDTPVYLHAKKDPYQPILYAGSLDAPVCFFGRDLGKDEVRLGQPLIGAGGRLVREGILDAIGGGPAEGKYSQVQLDSAIQHALLTNTMPYKPPGNKAYSEAVKERFRPFLLELLSRFWQGRQVITLGTEAFQWFEPYIDREQFPRPGAGDGRFEVAFDGLLPRPGTGGSRSAAKPCRIRPLPHPSPLNRRWFAQFPAMIARRLAEAGEEVGDTAG